MAKEKYYVVWVGHNPGIYDDWTACKAQVEGFAGAKFKSYPSRSEAEQAWQNGWEQNLGPNGLGPNGRAAPSVKSGDSPASNARVIDYDSISVDVGTRGNPGPVEYKGVDTRTGEVLFAYGPIAKGTNNLGEFLAIVHALAFLKKRGSSKTVYSDSSTAIKWVRQKRVDSQLVRDESTREIWSLVDRALLWLHNNSYPNKLLKWDTASWGEIKADYGRK